MINVSRRQRGGARRHAASERFTAQRVRFHRSSLPGSRRATLPRSDIDQHLLSSLKTASALYACLCWTDTPFSGALFGIHFRRSGVIQLGLHGGGPPPCCGGIVIQAPPATDGGRNRPRDTQRPDRLSFYAPPAGEEGRLPRGRIIRSASVERPLGAPEALGIPVPFQGSTGDLVSEQLPGSGGFVIHPRTGAHQNGATRGRVWLSP